MKEFFRNMISTIKDDRWSWKFKLCNIITNDYLRQNLAYSRLHISSIMDLQDCISDRQPPIMKHVLRNARRAQEHIDEIWRI